MIMMIKILVKIVAPTPVATAAITITNPNNKQRIALKQLQIDMSADSIFVVIVLPTSSSEATTARQLPLSSCIYSVRSPACSVFLVQYPGGFEGIYAAEYTVDFLTARHEFLRFRLKHR